jgi:hypothetical protein
MNIKIPFEFKLNMRLIMGLLLFISVTTAWSQDSFKVSGKVIGEDSNEGLIWMVNTLSLPKIATQ